MSAAVTPLPVRGIWIGASYVLDRPVPVGEPYPHVCETWVQGRMTPHRRVILGRRDCAACLQEANDARQTPDVHDLPATDPAAAALEARRLGEREEDR